MLPDLLASRRGRFTAFFALYVTEGIPLGFAATAIATQLRRQGVGPAEIGAFIGSFYLPWAFKWAVGPFVDTYRSRRWGHRRGWILFTQLMMVVTLLALIPIPLPQGLGLFTAILFIHNSFGAIQDVAIDSLAVNTLADDERGLANGLMFAGAGVGQAVGGSGVLFLLEYVPFQSTFFVVALAISLVTGFVVLPMKEAAAQALALLPGETPVRAALREMRSFAVESFRSFVGTRGAFYGVFFALLPAGAMSLGLALQANLGVELGMSDESVASLALWSGLLSSAATVLGGWLSDKWGRRRTLAFYLVGMSLPVLYLMWVLQQAGYLMPRQVGGPPLPNLIWHFWVANFWYSFFQGLMYGTRSAIMMDITNPRVAATQFTAYMALMNLAIALAAMWQGVAVEAWGYPVTLLVDALVGPLCCLLLPWLKEPKSFADGHAQGRARKMAFVLGLLCLGWALFWMNRQAVGAALPIVNTFYTLVFVGSALFMLASRDVLGADAGAWRAAALWIAPLLFAMYGRYFLHQLPLPLKPLADALLFVVPVLGGIVLLALSRRDWRGADAVE